MQQQTHAIIGGGLAGASAAAALRKEGFDGRIVLVGEEGHRPYERPELSKKYLRAEPETDVFVHEPNFYADARIELLTGEPVTSIDPRAKTVAIGSNVIPFDRLLLATGAIPRRPRLPGADLDGVVTLRTIEDADAIRDRARAAGNVVVVGGGWIGSEVAASLRQLGANVTLVAPTATPLERILGPELGAVYADAHTEHGVRLVGGTVVDSFAGRDRVTAVHTADGQSLPAELVVMGIGAEPRVDLAATAGLAIENGVVVNDRLETSAPGIFAAGDVANAWHQLYRRQLRVEHWDNAKRQGRHAAGNMLGRDRSYDRIPYFYSDQYDLGMEYRGLATASDEVVFRGDPRDREFIAFWLRDGRVAAAMNLNVWDVDPALTDLVRSGVVVDRAWLQDPGRPIAELAAA